MPELGDIPLGGIEEAVQVGLMRLHLALTGETHRMVVDLGRRMRGALSERAGDPTGSGQAGVLDVVGGMSALAEVEALWREFFASWSELFGRARWEAGALAFGGLARMHQGVFDIGDEVLESGRPLTGSGRLLEEQVEASPVFEPQLQGVLDAASQRVYSDGFRLSERLWRLDRDSLEGIRRTVLDGVANGDSAWNIAGRLERYLGAEAECPRWTSTRLYRLTKKEIAAGDRRGLISRLRPGEPCLSRGVAYNALRLARNEIQIAHHLTTDEIWSRVPWIEREQIVLSPEHPPIGCECEDVVVGGEDGDGVYAKGEVTLPIHVQCLCFKLAVLMAADRFVGRLREWMAGGSWPEMDEYGDWVLGMGDLVGADREALAEPDLLVSWGSSLVIWLWGDREAVAGVLGIG